MSQVIKKRKIVIASVLKPVDDTRMFEKIGCSLASFNDYEIHIIGFRSLKTPRFNNIIFHILPYFRRISLGRIVAPCRIFFKLLRLKPYLLIVTTHELLVAATFIRWIFKTKVVYDVQENYFRNILYLSPLPFFIRQPLAHFVGLKEIMLTPAIHLFVLAEAAYVNEMRFTQRKAIVLENKALCRQSYPSRSALSAKEQTNFLFSGTLARSTGVLLAIDIIKKLRMVSSQVNLTLIGYCPHPDVLEEIESVIKNHPYITLIGGNELVPHTNIVEQIIKADVGIISYLPSMVNDDKIPTKLYEYLAYQLPILLIDHPPWIARCAPYSAAVSFSEKNINAQTILAQLKTTPFYTVIPGPEVCWEGKILQETIEKLS